MNNIAVGRQKFDPGEISFFFNDRIDKMDEVVKPPVGCVLIITGILEEHAKV
ncbi:hypothetical protein SDC9_100214 [bioreactor metagenome]|uniref:Uncharacterized protein n=1 Tax=bioreactor metagenome TaxID=1076179 RepID=A0A645AKI4_9ZZZZ